MPRLPDKQCTGGFVDESLSDDAIKLLHKIDSNPELEKSVREVVGRYRGLKRYADTQPNKTQKVEQLNKIQSRVNDLLVEFGRVPESAKAYISDVLLERNQFYEVFERDLEHQLMFFRSLLSNAQEKIQVNEPANRRPTNNLINDLLVEVFVLIRPYISGQNQKSAAAEAARNLISSVLGEENITLTSDPKKLLEIIPKESK